MTHLSRITTVGLSAAALSLVIAGCQPQEGAPASQATESAAPEATAADEPINVIAGSEQIELFVGNTVIGVYDAWNLTWAEYFSPDGTTKLLLRFEGKDDMEATGKYYSNNSGQFCTEDPEQNVYCHNLFLLGDGRYQQLYSSGEKGAIYEKILKGDQVEAFK